MKRIVWTALFSVSAALVSGAPAGGSGPLVLSALTDFPTLQVEGFAPTRVDHEKKVISVDGDITGFAFGMAQTTFAGPDGTYEVTLTTVQDGDGVCDYFLRVGTWKSTTYRQSGTTNGEPEDQMWKGVVLRRGDVIGVAGNGSDSKQNAPGKGPRGFHMAHGRWSKLTLVRTGDAPPRTASASMRRHTPSERARASSPDFISTFRSSPSFGVHSTSERAADGGE